MYDCGSDIGGAGCEIQVELSHYVSVSATVWNCQPPTVERVSLYVCVYSTLCRCIEYLKCTAFKSSSNSYSHCSHPQLKVCEHPMIEST